MILSARAYHVLLFTLSVGIVAAQTPAQIELFEKNARPLFAEKCQPCHSAKLRSGGFDLSTVEGMKEAAAMGIFGKASELDNSPILRALSYENRIKMPPQGKLPPEEDICPPRVDRRRGADSRSCTKRGQFAGGHRSSASCTARSNHGRGYELLGLQTVISKCTTATARESMGSQLN